MNHEQFKCKVNDVVNLVNDASITIPLAVEMVCGESINKANSELQFALQDAAEKELNPEWWIKDLNF